jgi:hypothetical protein
MSSKDDGKLSPRNGHILVVDIVARISGCQNQKELSLEDQIDHAKEIVADLYDGPVEYRVIATKGKGERLDRPELIRIEAKLRTRESDLLFLDDLGRLVRGAEAVRLLGVAVDHGVRVISPNDCIDTAEATWEEDALSACRDHVGHNAHTSKRLKQKLMNRFVKFGGAIAREIAGYIVPENAKIYDEWLRDENATPDIQEGLKLLRETLNCCTVADFFNRAGFQRGPYTKRKHWLGSDVREFYQNRLLGGFPGRGFKHTVKVHETGRRVPVKNPKGPKFRECPHLAHVDIVELDEVNALLAEKNQNYRRRDGNGSDSRRHVARKRTRFPGQHAHCWYCGWPEVWGGNGITENLMCSGAREWHCWNSIGFNGELAATKTVEIVTTGLRELEGLDEQFAELVQIAHQQTVGDPGARWQQLQRDELKLEHERGNLLAAIAAYGPRSDVKEKLAELDAKELVLARERFALEQLQARRLVLPESPVVLREHLDQQFQRLAIDSPEFGDLLRLLVPQFHVYMVRMCDGGNLLPRAIVEVNLAGDFRDVPLAPDLHRLLTKRCTLDLFKPVLRERIRLRAVAIAAENPKMALYKIAERLPEKPSWPVVGQALKLHQRMLSLGLSSPYLPVLEPPPDLTKLRRNKHPRYRFEPRPGYERPAL